MNLKRVKKINSQPEKNGKVVYLMSRDQRVADNWALIFAFDKAVASGAELEVLFAFDANFHSANFRSLSFMFDGLKQVAKELRSLNIKFNVIIGSPDIVVPKYLYDEKAGVLVMDFDPLKIKRYWRDSISKNIDIACYEVDAHNIVPTFIASEKQEFGAYTLRPKLNKLKSEFLDNFPKLNYFVNNESLLAEFDFSEIDTIIGRAEHIKTCSFSSGEAFAHTELNNFVANKLDYYSEKRNHPNLDFQSNLSPYLHFGQISSQRIVLDILALDSINSSAEAFIEEIFVRKELSDNFCFYNSNYDNFDAFPNWAKDTLNEHRKDKRDYIYTIDEFENAQTNDIYWNAAQNEMLESGKMHAYMRMYWCKKILEWTENPESAMEIAIYLNDKYSIDGRDPNGYTGIAWSIGGVHDRAWKERAVFGKIRYMNDKGLERKYDMKGYLEKWS